MGDDDKYERATAIKVVTNEDVPGGVGSITSSKIKFGFYVTDFYGNTKEYVFYVKVKENK